MRQTTLKSVTAESCCPVCSKGHKCSRGADGVIFCGRLTGEQVGFVFMGKSQKDEQFSIYRREGDPVLQDRQRAKESHQGNGHKESTQPPIDWEAKAEYHAQKMTPDLRGELANALGLPESALALLKIGFDPEDFHGPCWTLPEANASGMIVGLNRRYRDGTKKAMPLASRGLTMPDGWKDRHGPILLPEGPSDSLTAAALGLCAVGRPSNMGGVEFLAELLKDVPPDRPIVVLGEMDPKPTGRWPGLEGATKTASALAEKLGRPVFWVLPPEEKKDLRAWALAQDLPRNCADSWQEAGQALAGALQGQWHKVDGTVKAAGSSGAFPTPVPASELVAPADGGDDLWFGYLKKGNITLFSALWKSGKSTLLAHLLKQFGNGGLFCGQNTLMSTVLYVSEEGPGLWIERRDRLGIGDYTHFLCRPFLAKLTMAGWLEFIAYLEKLLKDRPFDLVVLDTTAGFWPVQNENDASEVQEAIMPLRRLSESSALLLVHHMGKGKGKEATASRGSGALTAFVDTIIEMDRKNPNDLSCRRRVLTAIGRHDSTPLENCIELAADGSEFISHGTKGRAEAKEIESVILGMLPTSPPGIIAEEITKNWPDGKPPQKQKLLNALRGGVSTLWNRAGDGKRGDPFRFWAR